MTVQGPVKEQQRDGMSHRGGGGGWVRPPRGPGKYYSFQAKKWVKNFLGVGGWVSLTQNTPTRPF